MSDSLMAFYDEDRDAVVVRLLSGTEVAVMDCDEAACFADEVRAASGKDSTGYEEFFAQENGEDDPDDAPEYLRSGGEPVDEEYRDGDGGDEVLGACILTAETMSTADDCTMHDHEAN